MAARVVDLPEPVGPVTTINPLCNMENFFSTAGSGASNFSKSSNDKTLLGIWRKTAAMPFFWVKKLARKRETPVISYPKSTSPVSSNVLILYSGAIS